MYPLIFTVMLSGSIVKRLKHNKLEKDINWFFLAILELGYVFQQSQLTLVA